ncbi:aminopeptidase P family protein [Gallicola sp. Sow4_E12]|uniref:aminopeptidase P family protein n=1 Tax=Gallicola sp. Sow4_E12 TaxID=3438785 RepID=UPI003F90364C
MLNDFLKDLRQKMKGRTMEAYIIPSSDPHNSEYLSDYYKSVEFISRFTGSQGTVVVTQDKAGLWTDGRYFIQAQKELRGTGIDLYRMGTEDPSIIDFLKEEVSDFGKIGIQGETCSYKYYMELKKGIGTRVLITNVDFIDEIWKFRPAKPKKEIRILSEDVTGKSAADKILQLQKYMQNSGIDYYFIGSLDDICYLFNIRGGDIDYNPVVLSYSLITQNSSAIYIDEEKCSDEVLDYFSSQGVKVRKYDGIYIDLKEIPGKSTLSFDPQKTNMDIYDSVNHNVRFIKETNITTFMKAIKNDTEIKNMKNAFIKDGIALVKYLHWLETGVPTGNVTEASGASRLESFRKEQGGYIEPSFKTISAYGENAALPHYTPVPGRVSDLKEQGFYLVDSGGQYSNGTTDITRTIALGSLTEEEKRDYTLVLKAHIALMKAKFKEGTKGAALDAIARNPLWKEGVDFNHGTGHGVGFMLSCHEGPQSISPRNTEIEIEKKMITSNEPGIYREGKHGIRIENIMLCVESEETEFGRFLEFECISFCPIDTKPIIKEMLTKEEIAWINQYHKDCFEKLAQGLNGAEAEFLKEVTKSI